MDLENKPKKKFRHPDRITLTPETLARLSAWLEQVAGQVRGLRLTRADLLNFLVKASPEKLTSSQVLEIEKEYFNEVKFHEWALRELKKSKKLGLKTTYAEITGQKLRTLPKAKSEHPDSSKKKPKTPEPESNTSPLSDQVQTPSLK